MRTPVVYFAGLLALSSTAGAAELRLQWQALGPDDRVWMATPGNTMVVDIYFEMSEGDSITAVSFSNEFAPLLSQISTTARDGWDDESVNGVLGGPGQRVSFSGPALYGPGKALIGSQTIRLDDAGDGSTKLVMFSTDAELLDEGGNPYDFSPFPTDMIGWYTFGAGFPNTIWCDPTPCPPDPLIVDLIVPGQDCNGNYIEDAFDIAIGTSLDNDGSGVPDECEVAILYVNADATGLEYGTSWAHAYNDLRDAFDVAHGVGSATTEIWVARGIYVPGTSRGATFRLKNGLAIYGGFAGGETSLGQRYPRAHPTILSGDLNGDDGPGFVNNDENSYHVVSDDDNETDSTAILDGFIITGGNANGSAPDDGGGGLYVYSGGPTLANCTFIHNRASNTGGGIVYRWCGGIYSAPPTLINCRFFGNTAYDGGAIYNRTSTPTVINCEFSGNTADNRAGAIHHWPGSSPDLINCTFSGNTAGSEGGAIYVSSQCNPTLTNCILWGNSSPPLVVYGSATVSYTDIQGGWAGTGNLDEDPLFVDADGSDGIVGTEDDDLRLAATSPCIDVGDNSVVTLSTDLEGNPRILDGDGDTTATVDLGAYEFQVPAIPTLGEWGAIVLALMVVTTGTLVFRARRPVEA